MDGISGIGYSPFGMMGLGSTGMYSSYDPYMMCPGMMGVGYGMLGSGYGGYGYGMYDPVNYMQRMMDMQNQVELNNANHTSVMHNTMLNNEVKANRESISAMFSKTTSGGSVDTKLRSLISSVESGHLDAACTNFDVLREQVIQTYADELAAYGGKENIYAAANAYIEQLYSDHTGRSIKDDFVKYGDDALKNGFLQEFRPGHDKRTAQQALNYCFGDPMSEIEHEENSKNVAKVAGAGAKVVVDGAKGAAICGVGTGVAVMGVSGLIKGAFGRKYISDKNIEKLLSGQSAETIEELKKAAGNNIHKLQKAIDKKGIENVKVVEGFRSSPMNWVSKNVHPLKWGWKTGKYAALVGIVLGIGYGIYNRTKANA